MGKTLSLVASAAATAAPKGAAASVLDDSEDVLQSVEDALKEEEDQDASALVEEMETDDGTSSEQKIATAEDVATSHHSGYTDDVVSQMSDAEMELAEQQVAKKETTIGTKTYQTGGYTIEEDGERLDKLYPEEEDADTKTEEDLDAKRKEQEELLGGTITECEDNPGMQHYEGSLGSFDYNPTQWAVGTKEITNAEGTITTTIPVLRYIGSTKAGNDIKIPEGVKSIDYTFEGNETIETVPVIPDSVESAHCAFMGCMSITRACKNAKEGEKGITPFQNDTVEGQGGFGGTFSLNPFAWGNADGKGGTWSMGDNLKDASGMFYDCTALTESYTRAGKGLVFAQDMYRNTTKMGRDETAMLHGSSARMDCTQSLMLTPSATNGLYEGSNVDVAKSYTDLDSKNYSVYWDEATGTMDTYEFYKAGGTDKELEAIEELEEAQKRDQVLFGGAQTDMYSVTGGQANHATVRDAMGYSSTSNVQDENALNHYSEGIGTENIEEGAAAKQASASGGGNLIDRGIVSLGEYAILKKLTGSTLLSVGITAGGQLLGILPKSMTPILDGVAGFVGEDSAIGKGLTELSNNLKGVENEEAPTLEEQKQDLERDALDETTADTDVRILTDMQAPMDVAASEQTADITHRMGLNGATITQDHVLLTVANKDEKNSEILNVQVMMEGISEGLEEKTKELADANGGTLSEEDKQLVAMQYMNVMRGLEAYDNGATEAMRTTYAGDISNQQKAERGLGKVMRLSVGPMYDSILELNEQYDFLSEQNLQELKEMELTGCTSFDQYTIGMDMAPAQDVDVAKVQAQQQALEEGKSADEIEQAGLAAEAAAGSYLTDTELDPEDELYANAGLTEEDMTVPETSKETTVSKTTGATTEKPVKNMESEKTVKTTKSRGAEAEERFGSIVEVSEQQEADLEY